ncbi:hypothetical protein FPY71_13140 [Aureimonas fodinaquatilis]|uniref:Thaumarchaeal output domain-containing protein n=1 Tax=Aureimonas fodinaquatilis TaxID=2565783 RepID=A0A5B0DV57_9HYPH|nr:hypothetical protein [Aureimonas fodinaquatilis]KAA0969480.1 hypothetical protein FPY71_13140 [Aureimonas fodinaquatilis]
MSSIDIAVPLPLRNSLQLDAAYGTDASKVTLAIVEHWSDLNGLVDSASALHHSIPVISLDQSDAADVAVGAGEVASAIETLRPIAHRLLKVPEQIRYSEDPALGLLLYIAVRHGVMQPEFSFRHPQIANFRERARFPNLDEVCTELVSRGHLLAKFSERLNHCPNCLSARILVRDQCHHCASSRIRDRAVIHHYQCATQAPEQQFQNEDGQLRCPKCRRFLNNVSVDYEVSTELCECEACGELSQHPDVGFRCTDCGLAGVGQALLEKDVESFLVTAAGMALVFGSEDEAVGAVSSPE